MDNEDWEDLRVFAAACKAGSFSRAAEQLGMGQATVSRRIAALEARLGLTLFDRHRSGLVPLPGAEVLEPYVLSAVEWLRNGMAALQGLETTVRGLVRIAVPPGIGADLFPRVLPELRRRYAELEIEILSTDLGPNLVEREVDIAIMTEPPDSSDFVALRFAEARLGLFASADYLRGLGCDPVLDDLEFIQWTEGLYHHPMARWIAEHTRRRPRLRTNSLSVMRSAAARGLGVVVLPELQARLASLQVVTVSHPPLPDHPSFLVVHRALRQIPRIRAVVDLLRAALAQILTGDLELAPGWSEG